jgi:hypothetical protein
MAHPNPLVMAKGKRALRVPSVAEVAEELRVVRHQFEDDPNFQDDEPLDVRLQVYEDGEWAVHFGDPQYDTDHRGYWGAGSIAPYSATAADLREVARELIDEVSESVYLANAPITRAQLESLAWTHTHRDYRGTVDGERAVLVLHRGATVLRPLAMFNVSELARYVERAQGMAANPRGLKSTQDTKATEKLVRSVASARFGRGRGKPFFEHGQWFVEVGRRFYSVVDAVPGYDGRGIDFEALG